MQLDDSKKLAIFSDLHLGTGGSNDNSLQNNSHLFYALEQYYKDGYVVLLLGDTFEIAENKSIDDIKNAHSNIMWILEKLYQEDRLVIVKGNHDDALSSIDLWSRVDPYTGKIIPFLNGIKLYNSAVLDDYVMVHGHQDSFVFSSSLNQFINFSLRFWGLLENVIFKDPTKESLGWEAAGKTDKFFIEYANKTKKTVIIGHTHATKIMGNYHNIGAGVMPRCVTVCEIADKELKHYKWSTVADESGVLAIKKSFLG